MSLSVSAPRDLKEITYRVDKQIKQFLETVPDVGAVVMNGGRTRAVQVAVDIDKLRARGLTIEDVRNALLQQNLELPQGRVDQGTRELVVPGLPYIVVYRVGSDAVEILRVYHTAMNWPQHVRDR